MARRECGEENYPRPLLAVAGHGLPGSTRRFPVEPLSDKSFTALTAAAREHRVTGLLCAAIDDGALPATDVQAESARRRHLKQQFRVLSLEHELVALVDLLDGAGLDYRVLKGTAVAHLDYPDPALRSFIDLDVLVQADDFDRVVEVLTTAGFVRRLMEPRPGFDRRFDKGTTLVGASGYELDLHRTFVLGPWGLVVRLDDLWSDGGAEVSIGGRPIRALSWQNRFMHACYHAALGDWPLRLASLRDVVQIHLSRPDDSASLRALAARWRAEAVVAAAVADAWRLLGLGTDTDLSSWAKQYVFTRQEEGRLALHTHADKTFAAQAVSTLVALPRLRDKAAYLWALVLPDAEYVGDRHSSALARFRYGIREIRRGRARQN